MDDYSFEEQLNFAKLYNDAGKYYVAIPDVHGMLDELDRVLLGVENWRKSNQIKKDNIQYVFLGDYIDRGPDPLGVISRVKEYVKSGAICLLGNHDMFLVGTGDMSRTQFENGQHAYQSHLWYINNGEDTCRQMFGDPSKNSVAIQAELSTEPTGVPVNIYREQILASAEYAFLKEHGKLFYETESIFFCHAPQSQKEYTTNSLVWGMRSDYSHQKGDACFLTPNNKQMSVHGHFHRLNEGINFPRIHNYMHGGVSKQVVLADTGCGCGSNGRLMAVVIKEYTRMGKAPRIMAII